MSVLNVQDSVVGKPGTEGIQIEASIDGGIRLTLQDSPVGRRYNCTLRGTEEKKWDGTLAADQLARALRTPRRAAPVPAKLPESGKRVAPPIPVPTLPAPPPAAPIMALLWRKNPDGIVSSYAVYEAAKQSRYGSSLRSVAQLEKLGCLVRLGAPYAKLFGLKPQDDSVSLEAWKLRCEELLRVRRALTMNERRLENRDLDLSRLASFEARLAKAQRERDGFTALVEQRKAELLSDEKIRELRERLEALLDGK
jgi:hypothetical protein